MKVLFVGRILIDQYIDKRKFGGNVLNQASILSKLIDPSNIHLISSISLADSSLIEYIKELNISFYNIEANTTPIIKYNKANKVIDVNLYDLDSSFNQDTISKYDDVIKKASIIVCDLGNKGIVEHIIKVNPKAKLIIEPISAYYVKNLTYKICSKTYLFKGNKEEVSTLTNTQIKNKDDCFVVVDRLKLLGLKRAFITLDKKGSYYFDEHTIGYKETKLVTNKIIVGAGDIFLAGIIYALRITQDIDILADYANRTFNNFYNKL